MSLGERIKDCRKKAKLSQEKVAELVGVSRQAVTKWEADKTAPNTENLFKLAEIFGTTVDLLASPGGSSKPSPAGQGINYKKNLKTALAVTAAYLLTYLAGRVICGDFGQSSFLGWLTDTDSRYYLFGWLTHQGLFWIAMAISVFPALLGKYRFSAITYAAFVVGIFAGELFGPNPAGEGTGHTHYGWAIWGGIFFASMVIGVVWELVIRKQKQAGRFSGSVQGKDLMIE